ncbi:hypothetical protein DPMN_061886 [Dreissena polymorpha]|uniref:Uncharacterized protein n=1 Tax=Dreissena polymorpha TaxID=45954 RepID=A0A9D4HIU9_DREPO|nr:hypothetical protein DPMN_061886 [Dreissena polymorpha]
MTKTCYIFFTALQRLHEVKFTSMEISFHDSSILDVSMEVAIDCNNLWKYMGDFTKPETIMKRKNCRQQTY